MGWGVPPTSAWLLLSWESERQGGWDPRHLSQALAFHSLPLPGCPISSILPPPAPSLLPHPGLGSFRDRRNERNASCGVPGQQGRRGGWG